MKRACVRESMPWLALLFALPFGVIGCSGSGGESPSPVGQTECDPNRSGYAGDCLALQAPDPDKGFQLHFGPPSYDPADVQPFLLAPGKEKVTCLYMTTPNDHDIYFSGYHASVRPGTHHMIIWAGPNGANGPEPPPDGTLTDECRDNLPFLVGIQNGIGPEGSRIDIPAPGTPIAPENVGLATIIPAHSRVAFQTHYVNTGNAPLLRESWANFVYQPPEKVTQPMSPLFWIGGIGMDVPPNSNQVIRASCSNDTSETRRLTAITGHMHAHGVRFSAYKVASGSSARELVYEDYDWSHSQLYAYDSLNKNPRPDAAARRSGAASGELLLNPGDRIEWECEVHNTTNASLKFADQAYTAEMCNLFGGFTPGGVGAWNCFNQ